MNSLKKFNRQDWAVIFCVVLLSAFALAMLAGLVGCAPPPELVEYERRYNETFPTNEGISQTLINVSTREALYQDSGSELIELRNSKSIRVYFDTLTCQVVYKPVSNGSTQVVVVVSVADYYDRSEKLDKLHEACTERTDE